MGKGTVSLEGESLILTGKRVLPFWAQFAVVVCAAATSLGLLGVGWPLALAILLFGRLRHREAWPVDSVRSVIHEARRDRFLVTANVGGRLQCVGWQARGDPAPLAGALRQRLVESFREGPVRGWRTF